MLTVLAVAAVWLAVASATADLLHHQLGRHGYAPASVKAQLWLEAAAIAFPVGWVLAARLAGPTAAEDRR